MPTNKFPGYPHRNKKEQFKRTQDMVKFSAGEDLKQIKPRKERSDSGGSHNKPEEALRNDVIKELRRSGFDVKRIENSITGKNNTGIPDLLVINQSANFMGFVEVKTPENWKANKLKGNQLKFRQDCRRCGVNHWIIRSVDELYCVRMGTTIFEPEVDSRRLIN